MDKKSIVILCLSFFILGFILCFGLLNLKDVKLSTKSIDTNCSEKSLKATVDCINEGVKEIFNYNISNRDKDLTLSQLKNEGGVCTHWSEYYIQAAKDNGYTGEPIVLKAVNHEIAVLYDIENRDYCITDQTSYWCMNLVKENKTDEEFQRMKIELTKN